MGTVQRIERFKPSPEKDHARSALRTFLTTLEDGRRLSWLEIEQATGISMDSGGRALFRVVCGRAGRYYRAILGEGIEMSSHSNTVEIVAGKTRRAVNGMRRAEVTTSGLLARHGDEMTQADRNAIVFHKSLFASLDLASSLTKNLPAKK